MAGVRLQLLGPPTFSTDSEILHLSRRKSLALVAFLAVERRAHSRDELATLLWPASGQTAARKNLRQSLFSLREVLGAEGLTSGQDTVELAQGALSVDVEEFRLLSAPCPSHSSDEACDACASDLERAVAVYRDDLPSGFSVPDSTLYDEWQLSATEELRTNLGSLLSRLVIYYERARAWGSSLAVARRLLSLDPLEEGAHRTVMRLLALSGQRAGALREYRKCVRLLEDELGSAPEPETNVLHEKIRTRRFPTPDGEHGGSPVHDGHRTGTNGAPVGGVCLVRADTHFEQVRRLIEETTGHPAGTWRGSLVAATRGFVAPSSLRSRFKNLPRPSPLRTAESLRESPSRWTRIPGSDRMRTATTTITPFRY